MTSQRRKSGAAVGGAAVLIGLTAVAFTLDGSPTPRPWYLFAGVAAAFTLLAVGVAVAGDGSALTLGAGAYVTLLGGFFLRASPFVRVVSSGYDYGRWLGYAEQFVETGALNAGDMYSASPLYILDVTVGNWVVGGPMYSARFFTVAIASALPLLVGILTYRITNRPFVSYLGVVLGTAAPLFFRTSVLLESESLALCWFVLGTYLFVRCFETADRRYQALFLGVAGTAVIVHFFYGVVLFTTVAGTLASWHVLKGNEGVRLPRAVHSFRLDLSVGAVGVVTTSWILWSTYAHTAILTFESGTTVRELSNPLALFIPSSGSTGASIGAAASDAVAGAGATGGSTVAASLPVQLYPILILLAVGCAGAAFAYLNLPRSHVGLVVFGVVGVLSVVATVVGLDYDLGFRMYYFAVIFALPFAAVGLGAALRTDRAGIAGHQPLAVVAVAVLVFSYALIAPVTPIGNNVDPKLGGNSWEMTRTEHDQLTQLDVRFGDEVYVDNRLPQTHEYFVPGGSPPENEVDRPLYITSSGCGNASRVSDTSSYSVCLLPSE